MSEGGGVRDPHPTTHMNCTPLAQSHPQNSLPRGSLCPAKKKKNGAGGFGQSGERHKKRLPSHTPPPTPRSPASNPAPTHAHNKRIEYGVGGPFQFTCPPAWRRQPWRPRPWQRRAARERKGGERKKKTNDQPPHLRTPRIQASLTGTQGTQRPAPAASLAQQWIAQAGAGCWSVCGPWGGQAGRGKTRSPHPQKKRRRGEKKPQRTARSFSPSSFHTLPSSLPSSVKLSSVWTQGGHRGVGGKEGGGRGTLEWAWLIGTQVCVGMRFKRSCTPYPPSRRTPTARLGKRGMRMPMQHTDG